MEYQQEKLYQLLQKCQSVFDGDLGALPGKPMELELKSPDLLPYHGRAYPMPKIHKKLVREEVNHLCSLKVLQRVNELEWGAPSFGIPKKNGEIQFVSDFRQLNKVLRQKPYPLPVPHEYYRSLDGFSFCTSMDLKMGFWAIHLSPYSQQLCTIVLPWGKYRYLHLPMGLSVSPDIYQEKMSNLVVDMTKVIVYIDDILVITKGSFQEHLKILEEVLRRLALHRLKVHADKSKFCGFKTEFLGFTLCREGICPQEKKVEAIQALKHQRTLNKSVRF
jgi:Reverse transcriptase (RNA-dependent DNA polymerase)